MRRLVPALFLLFASCGGSPSPESKTPDNVTSVSAKAAPKRTVSRELAARWPLAGVTSWAYLDVAKLHESEVAQAFASLASTSDDIPEKERVCIKTLFAQTKEVLVGTASLPRVFFAARVEGDGATFVECMDLGTKWKTITLPGAKLAFERASKDEVEILATAPGFVFSGTKEDVSAALAGKPASLPSIGLVNDEVASVHWKDDDTSADGALALSEEHFLISATADLPEEDAAKKIERLLGQYKELPLDPSSSDVAKQIEHIRSAFSVRRTGKTISAKFELVETPKEQAFDIGVLATLAVSGFRKYIARSKIAEAKYSLGAIARSMKSLYAEGASKKFTSIAATPREVPKGTKYQSTPADWKPWSKLSFSLEEPQYFQYEVIAAKDGKSADIVARGDLNGDGKKSEFRLHVAIEGGNFVLGDAIVETAPFE